MLAIGLNRPDKRNAFTLAMIADLARAYALLESDDTLWAGVLFAHGDHFTAGLDLADVGPAILAGAQPIPDDGRDPWRLDGPWTKPVVAAAHGWCMTAGDRAPVGGRHPHRGRRHPLLPDGGPTGDVSVRGRHRPVPAPDRMGQCDALAADRRRVRCRRGTPHRPRAGGGADAAAAQGGPATLRKTIAERAAPLGVRTALASAHLAREQGDDAAIARLRPI